VMFRHPARGYLVGFRSGGVFRCGGLGDVEGV